MSLKKIGYIDLFAGCGGLSDGFERTRQYELLAAVEWEKYPCLAFQNRLRNKWCYKDAEERIVRFDIRRTDELLRGFKNDPEYGSHAGLIKLSRSKGGVDVIIGGPPCQAYSIAGRVRDEHGMHKDYRNFLFEAYLKVVNQVKPCLIVFENVEGMLTAAPGGVSIQDRIATGFDKIGYEIITDIRKFAVIDLSEYGVPQRRKRVVLIGIRRSGFSGNHQKIIRDFYTDILPKLKSRKKVTVEDCIGDLPRLSVLKNEVRENGRRYSHYPFQTSYLHHVPRYHNKRDIKIFQELAKDVATGKNEYTDAEVLKKLYTARTGRVSSVHKYYVLRSKEQSNTIVAHLYKDGLRHIHPDYKQARSITVREAARIQTFDDDFEFPGGMGDQFKMIGNAVPSLFAHKLALALIKLLSISKTAGRKVALVN